jgi:Ni/Co efflux regulator RcnB
MKHHTTIAVALALSLGAAALPAFSQDRDGRRDEPRQQQQQPRGDQERGRDEGQQARPARGWHKGGRMPPAYNQRQYVVDDWRGHHLSAPPRGYHWVQTGGDYVLVAIATGVILQLLLAH